MDETHQLLIDSFSIYSKMNSERGKWLFQITELGRLYVSVLYGLKNKNVKDSDVEELRELNNKIAKEWQEAH